MKIVVSVLLLGMFSGVMQAQTSSPSAAGPNYTSLPSVGGVNPWVLPISDTWKGYKQNYIFCGSACGDNLGLVFDPSAGYQAVSEGVGYGMLMAVMMNDRYTFNVIYDAAHDVMLDHATGLFHWRADNLGRITGQGSATDAELDIAAALIFAQARVDRGEWRQHEALPYGFRADTLLEAVWEYQIVEGQYLKPGDRFGGGGRDIINLSYFAPAWFRIFNEYQNTNRWDALIEQGYQSLYSTQGASRGLAPDWSTVDGQPAYQYCDVNGRDRSLCRYEMFYDAIRVPWRIGLDCLWFDEPRACEWSRRSMNFLASLSPDRKARMYDMDGLPIVNYRDMTMIGMWLVGALAANDRSTAAWLEEEFMQLARNTRNTLHFGGESEFYYNQSLAWFAASLLANNFRDLTRG